MLNTSNKFCQALKNDGKPCKAPPTKGGLCYFHANPDQARVLGQKGGRKNRYQVTGVLVPDNASTATLRTILDQMLGELLAGRLDPKVASAAAQLINTRRRLTETVELENRVSELERKLSELGGAPRNQPRGAGEKPDLLLWWMKNETGESDAKNVGGENGKA